MMYLRDYRVYNNLIFLLPVFAGLYKHELVFTLLAVLILLGSTFYHTSLLTEKSYTLQARAGDILIALSCYIYLFYFATFRQENSVQLSLYFALITTLAIFMVGKYYQSNLIHALFHTSIALVASAIVLI
jgi:hypothetical protein